MLLPLSKSLLLLLLLLESPFEMVAIVIVDLVKLSSVVLERRRKPPGAFDINVLGLGCGCGGFTKTGLPLLLFSFSTITISVGWLSIGISEADNGDVLLLLLFKRLLSVFALTFIGTGAVGFGGFFVATRGLAWSCGCGAWARSISIVEPQVASAVLKENLLSRCSCRFCKLKDGDL